MDQMTMDLPSTWQRDGDSYISPVNHHNPRPNKHDVRVWQYGPAEWAVACTGCGLNVVGLPTRAEAQWHATHHTDPTYQRPHDSEILYTSKGEEVETTMSDEDAAAVLLTMERSDFAQDLARGYGKHGSWTAGQRPWAHKLANEQRARNEAPVAEPIVPEILFPNTLNMMADAGGKYPKITIADGVVITYMTGGRSPGTITVTDGGSFQDNTFFGRIGTDGGWNPARAATDEVLAALQAFEADPVAVATEYGRRTGSCCFCRRELTNDGSIDVGYGPICAGKYGLPHPSN